MKGGSGPAGEAEAKEDRATASFLGSSQELELFGHRVVLVCHESSALAIFASAARNPPSGSVLYIFAMHMYLQFYREFTAEILKEFVEEDRTLKEREVSSMRLDKSGAGSTVTSERREYLLSLFQQYGKIPLT